MLNPEVDLVLRVITNDDRHAFGELVKLHQSAVRALLRRLTKGDDSRADDLAQETFIKAYRSIRKFRGASKFSSWLYRIAYNTFLNDVRKTKDTVPYDESLSKETVPSSSAASDLSSDLAEAMVHLNNEQIAVFDLYYKKGMSHSEVSNTLNMPLGTVKTRLSRGLETLRQYMKDWRKDD